MIITEGERVMKVTQLIGLAEEQRKLYRYLEKNNGLGGGLTEAYKHHQEGLELLIKYQGILNGGSVPKR